MTRDFTIGCDVRSIELMSAALVCLFYQKWQSLAQIALYLDISEPSGRDSLGYLQPFLTLEFVFPASAMPIPYMKAALMLAPRYTKGIFPQSIAFHWAKFHGR